MAPSGAEDLWFHDMVREFEPALIGIARRRVGGAADDIVQSVWETATRNRARLEPLPSEDRGRFLRATTVLIVRRHYRTQGRRLATQDRAAGPAQTANANDPEARLIVAEQAETLLAAFQQLSDTDQQIVRAICIAGTTYRQLAADTDTPDATIRQNLRRALRRLRDLFVELAGPEAWDEIDDEIIEMLVTCPD